MIAAVSVIAIEPGEEPALLRAQFEHLGLEVRMRRLGKPSDLFSAVDREAMPVDFAVLCGHGDERGFIFPEMVAGIDWLTLDNNRMAAEDLARHLMRVPPTVISTACRSGTRAVAEAFTKAGAERFIAPVDYPDGRDIAIFVAALAHGVVSRQLSWDHALVRANGLVGADSQFRLWPNLA